VKWLQRWRDNRSAGAKPTGGSTSPLEQHAEWLLDLVATQPDMTLNEIANIPNTDLPTSVSSEFTDNAKSRIDEAAGVVSGDSSTANSVGVKQVGRELGVRYLLEGSGRKAGNRVRIMSSRIIITPFPLEMPVCGLVTSVIRPRLG
jgi:hypothetical protein